MENILWNGKDFLDLIHHDNVSCRILSLLIENSALEETVLLQAGSKEKVRRALRLLQEKGLLECQVLEDKVVFELSEACYQSSWRSALGTTPGRRSHRFPEKSLRASLHQCRRNLFCGLARGRFLQAWRSGACQEMADCPAAECRVYLPEEGSEFGALKLGLPAASPVKYQWILFDPPEERNPEEEERRQEWIRMRDPEEPVRIIREEKEVSEKSEQK